MIKLLLILIIFGCCSTISYAQVRNLYCNVAKDTSYTSYYACTFNQQTLYNNEIAQIVPTYITGITNLNVSVVRFNGSSIYSLPAAIFTTFPNTNIMFATYIGIQEIKPNTFLNAAKLSQLYLYNNKLTTLPQDAFSGASNLVVLYVNSNQISTIDKNAFRGLSKVAALSIAFNPLKTLDPLTFSTLPLLQIIHLYSNGLTTLDENIFAYNTNLEVAHLAYNQLTSLPPNLFKYNLKLYFVLLQQNKITSLSYSMFSHLKNFKYLYLENNICINKSFTPTSTNPTINMTEVENALKNCTQIPSSPTCVDKSNDLAKIMGNMILDLNTVLGNYSTVLSNFIKT
jgi:carboxypeptidase N regulatory subunit